MRHLELIFVHVPKTGGSAITERLTNHFGDSLLRDFDRPIDPTSPMNMDPAGFLNRYHTSNYAFFDNKRAVTGHFWIRKYDPIAADIRATILRHPVSRTISHYFFWHSSFKFEEHPLREYMLSEKLDILAFSRLPAIRHFYTQHIFRDVDMSRFDYIASHEELVADSAGAMRRLGLDATLGTVNDTEGLLTEEQRRQRQEVMGNTKLMAALHDLLADDIRFYERAVGRS